MKPPRCSAPPTEPACRTPSSAMPISLTDDVRPQLDRLTKYPAHARRCACSCIGTRTRNITSPLGAILPAIRFSRQTSRYLADYGWTFDLQVSPTQMAGAADLAECCPR